MISTFKYQNVDYFPSKLNDPKKTIH